VSRAMKCPCCGGPTRWENMGTPSMCDGCNRKMCYYQPAGDPCNYKEAKE